ncbi:MAG: hypothetical protein FJX76_16795 [Armatimonadetes bacterium]|nr:hypothetical protein [Armatimonadota bacterium]
MGQFSAVVLLNGLPYRVEGVSHDQEGSRIRYASLEEVESAVLAKLDDCERVHPTGDAASIWIGKKGDDRYRVEARKTVKG